MKELMLGNEALACGARDAGIAVVSAYPGTPSTEITETIAKFDDVYAEWAANEKVAAEVAMGACVAGARMFGDLNDPDSDISKAIAAAGETDVLLPKAGLGPEIHYIGLNSALAMKRVSNVQQGGNVKTPYEA